MSDTGTFAIAGVPPPSNIEVKTKTIPYVVNMPSRYEVSDPRWSSDPVGQKQWTLFILGLEKFKNMNVDQKLSYFQVAGIHGYPETTWDNGPPPKADPTFDPNLVDPNTQKSLHPGAPPFGGYCHHNTIAFPAWHRPYMLLYEQCIWMNMTDILNGWKSQLSSTDFQAWTDAANAWRLPYWDYARTSVPALPDAFTVQNIEIFPPAGISIANPYPNSLWGFNNPEKDELGGIAKFGYMPTGKTMYNIKADTAGLPYMPWNYCTGVSRYGILLNDDGTYSGLEGINNVQVTNLALNEFSWYTKDHPASLKDAANRLLTQGTFSSWGAFASTKWKAEQEVSDYLSLEYIHNNVHNVTGGLSFNDPDKTGIKGVGHMSDVPVAAFDPIFWMHHCNVDRWFAFFQVLNWDLWFNPAEPTDGHPTIQRPNVPDVLPTDPLLPFHVTANADPQSNFFNSDMVRDWTKWGYTYDDLAPSADAINGDGTLNEQQYISDIQQYVHTIYKSTSALIHKVFENPKIHNDTFLGATDGTWNDYVINVVYDRFALEGRSYSIQFYLGGEKNDPQSAFADQKNYIGQVYNFAGMPPASSSSSSSTAPKGGCKNCGVQNDGNVLASAQVAITSQVVQQALHKDFTAIHVTTRDEVAKYLEGHLHWRVVQTGGAVVPVTKLPKTKITVWAGTGTPRDNIPPKYSDYEQLHGATRDKVGGAAV